MDEANWAKPAESAGFVLPDIEWRVDVVVVVVLSGVANEAVVEMTVTAGAEGERRAVPLLLLLLLLL
jgi:hypothetical protein